MSQANFKPNGLPVLIGSLPMNDHDAADRLVFEYTPEIPLWVQLPMYKYEGMIDQFIPGLPCVTVKGDKTFINTADEAFDQELLEFYEEYLMVSEDAADINTSRFALTPEIAQGFFALMEHVKTAGKEPAAIKGQITGPLTFATAVKNQEGRALFYDLQTRDAAVKILAMKAKWQVRQLSQFGKPVILFLDEPALAGFGSSEFISISKQEVIDALNEVIEAVHSEGGLAGIHVCANTEWDMVMDTQVDIVNFDAYSYFDKFILYADAVKKFMDAGKFIAWGIVPTSEPEDIDKETPESLTAKWESQMQQVQALGIEKSTILAQSFITPSCGTGSLSLAHATKVLQLTKAVSEKIRN